jgi:DNA-binding response OmpR family regulator
LNRMGNDEKQITTPFPPTPSSEEEKISGPTVLFIEDDSLLLKMYKTKFEHEGFNVISALDGEEGLSAALGQNVDLIILDIMMPRLSGLDMLGKYRQDPKGKGVPVVILTNLTREEEMKRAKELGVKEFIVKADYTPSEVVRKIKDYLGK